MSSIRELSFDEIAMVSGGGNAGDHERNSGRAASTNYAMADKLMASNRT